MNGERFDQTEMPEPSVAELWALLKQQQAEIAELRSRLTVTGEDRGEATAGKHQHARNGSTPRHGNGQHPAPARPASGRTGRRQCRGTPTTSGQQKLLPKPDDANPVAVERRLSRLGLLKAAAVGVVGVAAAEAEETLQAAPAAAASPGFIQRNFLAGAGTGTAFSTLTNGYDVGLNVAGNRNAILGTSTPKAVAGYPTIGSSTGAAIYGATRFDPSTTGVVYNIAGVKGEALHTDGRTVGDGFGVVGVGRPGVYGLTDDGAGVVGISPGGTALYGNGDVGLNVIGNRNGVVATTGAIAGSFPAIGSPQGAAVYGLNRSDPPNGNLGNAVGVKGESLQSDGKTISVSGIGVMGVGNVGLYGRTDTGYGVYGDSPGGIGVRGNSVSNSGVAGFSGGAHGVLGQTASDVAAGVIGSTGSTKGSRFNAGVTGYSQDSTTFGNGYGVQGLSNTGKGVFGGSYVDIGKTQPGSGIGVEGLTGTGTGVHGVSKDSSGALSTGTGVLGESATTGVHGVANSWAGNAVGVLGEDTTPGPAVGNVGVKGKSPYVGVWGQSTTGNGVFGFSHDQLGVSGQSANRVGVYGRTNGTDVESAGGLFLTYNPNSDSRGVIGASWNESTLNLANNVGVEGRSDGGAGILGRSVNFDSSSHLQLRDGTGVKGVTKGGVGVLGASFQDIGETAGAAGIGVLGESGTGTGVSGTSRGVGVQGASSGSLNTGVYGIQTTNDGTGVAGRSYKDSSQTTLGNGIGVWGDSGTGKGVLGTCQAIGVEGESTGVLSFLAGVRGLNTGNTGSGVIGISFADGTQTSLGAGFGVWGHSGGGAGVRGTAPAGGRGGVFSGDAAQLQMVPAAGAVPASGQDGDLFLDSSKQLWLCTAGGTTATWRQLGSGGGGGGTGPVVAHSTVAGTPGVLADNNSNDPNSIGVSASSIDGSGNPGAGIGLKGLAGSGTAVYGTSRDASSALSAGTGVLGETGSGTGVKGTATGGTAISGNASTGRGGIFSGGAAPLQLVPASGSHPASGQAGDLVVDSSNNLWFCQGGTNWLQLDAGGGGGSGGPLTGHSTVIATPGVYGYNDTADFRSIGVSGASVDTNGNPGNGTGVQGSSGSGDGVLGTATTGNGVHGTSTNGFGVWGVSDGIGVQGTSSGGVIGVQGIAAGGRGGVFAGGAAQVQLKPSSGSHPATGQEGDLFLDSAKQLWLCTVGDDPNGWKMVQLV